MKYKKQKIYELYLDVEPFISFNKNIPKFICMIASDSLLYDKFRIWWNKNKKKFDNEWDVLAIVNRYFVNKYYIPSRHRRDKHKRIKWKTKKKRKTQPI